MSETFYIISTNDPNYYDILAISTNFSREKPRCSLDKSKAVIQVREGYNPSPLLDGYTAISKDECVSLMQSDEWQNNSI